MTPEQLKASILQYAIQGKLVEQRPEEGTGGELYQQIQEEKQRLIKEGKIKREKPFSQNPAYQDYPFDIPDTWMFVRFGELLITRDSERIPVSVSDRNKRAKIYDYYGASGVIDKIDDYLFDKELLLIGEDGANLLSRSTPIAFIAKGKYWVNNHAHVLDACCNLNLDYVCYYINAISLAPYVTGTAQPKMNQENMNAIWIALPPLAEQKRIVAKIEELLPYVDRYAAAYEKLEQFNAKFPEDMKKSILQYAIQGNLVEQRPEEGTGSELYKQMQAEKQRLIKEKKIKKEKPLAEITDDEIPFEIPETWLWIRVGDVGSWGSGATPPRTNPAYYGGSIPWLKTGDLNDGFIKEVPEYITELALEKTSVRLNPVGSVLMAMYGATIGKLGILEIPATTNQACCACIPYTGMYNRYLFYYLMSMRQTYIGMAEGGAQPNISKEKIVNSILPLPPLDEQRRIIAKLEEILPLCERLK